MTNKTINRNAEIAITLALIISVLSLYSWVFWFSSQQYNYFSAFLMLPFAILIVLAFNIGMWVIRDVLLILLTKKPKLILTFTCSNEDLMIW